MRQDSDHQHFTPQPVSPAALECQDFDYQRYVPRPEDAFYSQWAAQPGADRVRELTGGPGSGKSWLLCHLHGRWNNGNPGRVVSVRIDFNQAAPDTRAELRVWSAAIANRLTAFLPSLRPDEADWEAAPLKNQIEAMVGGLRNCQPAVTLVILCDHIELADPALLKIFDQELLGPLLSSPCVKVLLVGRHIQHRWSLPVRENLARTPPQALREFDPTRAQQQLEKAQLPNVLQFLYPLGYGGESPFVNDCLGRRAREVSLADSARLAGAIDECVRDLLNRNAPPEPQLTLDQIVRLRDLAVARAFDVPQIKFSLQRLYGDELTDRPVIEGFIGPWKQAGHIRQNTGELKGDAVSADLRPILEAWLRVELGDDEWARRHQTAVDYYREARKGLLPEQQSLYDAEIAYHQGRCPQVQ